MKRTGIVAKLQGLLGRSATCTERPRAAPRDRRAREERNDMTKTARPESTVRPVADAGQGQTAETSITAALPVFLPSILRIWSAGQRIEQGGDPERALTMVRWHLENALDVLTEAGFEFRSYEGQPYDPGMRAIVPKFREDPDVPCETVGKTDTPAVFYNGLLIAKSKAVILAPPVSHETTARPSPGDDAVGDADPAIGDPVTVGAEGGAGDTVQGRTTEDAAVSMVGSENDAQGEETEDPQPGDQADGKSDNSADANTHRRENGER